MRCTNIIIVVGSDVEKDTSDLAEEVKKAAKQLRWKYAGRNVFDFQFDSQNETTNATKIEAIVKAFEKLSAEDRLALTGMYLIGHGSESDGMFLSMKSELKSDPCVFARAVCKFAEKGFKITKICVISCMAVRIKGEHKEEGNEPTPVPPQLDIQKGIYVQTLCRALSEVDQDRKLENLMVAGYISPVHVWDCPEASKAETKKTLKPGLKTVWPRRKPTPGELMRPRLPQQGKIKDREREAFKKNLKRYAQNKIVFKLQGGDWSFGKLSDYTDHRDEWRQELIEQEEPEFLDLPSDAQLEPFHQAFHLPDESLFELADDS